MLQSLSLFLSECKSMSPCPPLLNNIINWHKMYSMVDRKLLKLPVVYRDGLFVFRVDGGSIRARVSFWLCCQSLSNTFMMLYLRHLICSQVVNLLAFLQLRLSASDDSWSPKQCRAQNANQIEISCFRYPLGLPHAHTHLA